VSHSFTGVPVAFEQSEYVPVKSPQEVLVFPHWQRGAV